MPPSFTAKSLTPPGTSAYRTSLASRLIPLAAAAAIALAEAVAGERHPKGGGVAQPEGAQVHERRGRGEKPSGPWVPEPARANRHPACCQPAASSEEVALQGGHGEGQNCQERHEPRAGPGPRVLSASPRGRRPGLAQQGVGIGGGRHVQRERARQAAAPVEAQRQVSRAQRVRGPGPRKRQRRGAPAFCVCLSSKVGGNGGRRGKKFGATMPRSKCPALTGVNLPVEVRPQRRALAQAPRQKPYKTKHAVR